MFQSCSCSPVIVDDERDNDCDGLTDEEIRDDIGNPMKIYEIIGYLLLYCIKCNIEVAFFVWS